MPQFVAPFKIKDGSSTPVDVEYGPEQLSSGATVLVDRREASREMQPAIHIEFERPVPQRPSYKQVVRGIMPTVRVVNGVSVTGRPGRATLTFDLPANATAQERKHLFAMVVNAASHSLVRAGVENLDPLY